MERNELTDEVTEREATDREAPDGEGTVEEFDLQTLRNILEGLLLAAARPLSLEQLQALLGGETAPDKGMIRRALAALEADCAERGIELVEVASGFRLQVRQELQPWVSRLWEERPPRYSRALLETLALIAYRQPITRGEIEDVRGVSVSTNIIRQLEEREWIRVVGHRDVPGKPALFGTTKAFLDYFGLKNLDDLPSLAEIRDIDSLEPEFDFSGESGGGDQAPEAASGEGGTDGPKAAAPESEAAETGGHPGSDAGDSAAEPHAGTAVEVTDRPDRRDGEVSFDEDVPEFEETFGRKGAAAEHPRPDDEAEERPAGPEAETSARETDADDRAREESLHDSEAASGGRY